MILKGESIFTKSKIFLRNINRRIKIKYIFSLHSAILNNVIEFFLKKKKDNVIFKGKKNQITYLSSCSVVPAVNMSGKRLFRRGWPPASAVMARRGSDWTPVRPVK